MERMVGHWFHWLSDFATTWLPLAFFGILILTAWLLFKTVGMMPRVRPSTIDNRSRSHVTWSDVAGVEEVRAELMEVVDFLRDRQMLVPPPDLSGREAILGVHTRSKPLGPDVDLNQVARQTSGLTGAELANICNEAAIFAGRRSDAYVTQGDFDNAIERVVAGLQQKKVLTEKERRILAFHEGGHALMAHLMGSAMELQKVTIVSRGDALGYAFYLPEEDRYLHTKEELIDRMVVALAGRAAEEVVFGRVTNGAANDLEKVTEIARSMVFEWGMSDSVSSRTMRADNYALSETTKRLRDSEQARFTDTAYADALRLLQKHRAPLDRIAAALLDKETLGRDEVIDMFADVEPESRASDTVGMPRVVASRAVHSSPDFGV